MSDLFATIRIAIAPNASRSARAAGAAACRTLIHALDARAGRRSGSPALDGALRDIPSDQLLDLAIAKITRAGDVVPCTQVSGDVCGT